MVNDRAGVGATAGQLIQFARSPRLGGVKTRMMPYLSAEQACELHCELVLWTCSALSSVPDCEFELSVAGELAYPVFEACLHMGVDRLSQQQGDDLGARMHNALSAALEQHGKVVLVGSDCPGIDADYINQALCGLDDNDVVIGPAADGGYVLIAARHIEGSIFADIQWGTEAVLEQTLAALARTSLSVSILPELADIDRPEDLPIWDGIRMTDAWKAPAS